MRSILLPLLSATAFCMASPAAAQQVDEQLWTQTNVNVGLGDEWKATGELIARFSDRQDGLYQTEYGILISRKLSKKVEFGFGYRHVGSHNGNTADDENRLRQHIIATFGPVTTRFRVDERFHPDGDEIGFRIRPLVRYNHKVGGKGFGLFASHESFILPNSTDWGQRAGYDRMRNIVGVTMPLGKSIGSDIGYLNQYRFGKNGARDQMDHALTIQLSINLGTVGGHKADD